MRQLGYVEGKNIQIEVRSAEGQANRLRELASDVVRGNVDYLRRHGHEEAVLADLAVDAERMTALIDDLLVLSREDAAGTPNEVVRLNDRLPVKIVSIDTERRRLSLSARLADSA